MANTIFEQFDEAYSRWSILKGGEATSALKHRTSPDC